MHARASVVMRPIRVGAFFQQSDDFWYGLQVECDFRQNARASAIGVPLRAINEIVSGPETRSVRITSERGEDSETFAIDEAFRSAILDLQQNGAICLADYLD